MFAMDWPGFFFLSHSSRDEWETHTEGGSTVKGQKGRKSLSTRIALHISPEVHNSQFAGQHKLLSIPNLKGAEDAGLQCARDPQEVPGGLHQ